MMHWPAAGESRDSPGCSAPPPVRDTSKRADKEGDVVPKALRARRVLDPARSTALSHGAAIAVQQTLQHCYPSPGVVVEVHLRYELRIGSRAGQAQFAQSDGDWIRNDHATTVAIDVTEDVINISLAVQLDAVERVLERHCELGIGST